jgi:hypothetical protein
MARFDEGLFPEVREWAVALADGPEAAEKPLLRLVARMEREGDAEDQYTALTRLLNHYSQNGMREPALRVVDQVRALLAAHPEAGGFWDLSIARELIIQFREFRLAEPFIERYLARLRPEPDLSHRCHYGAWLLSLRLVIQVEEAAGVQAVAETLDGITELLGATYVHTDFLPTFRKLAAEPAHRDDLVHLLQRMWVEMTLQRRFYSMGSPDDLREVEELLAELGVRARE